MSYQVSCEGHSKRTRHIQFMFEDKGNLDEALELATLWAEDSEGALLQRDCPLDLEGGEALDAICLLFNDLEQAVRDGISRQDIKEVWPGKNKGLYRLTTHTL